MKRRLACVAVITLAACGDDGGKTPDAKIDAGSDATIDSMCGSKQLLTGELVDWDSTDSDANFCGVFGATFQQGTNTAMTAPNGRYLLCADEADPIIVNITVPTDPSPCAAAPGTYMTNATAYFPHAVVADGATFSARAITQERMATFFSADESGLVLDPTKGQLFVHVSGGSATVDIGADHDTTWSFDGTSWTAATTGTDLYFPNVGSTTDVNLASSPGADGDGMYNIPVGRFTYITIQL